MSESPRMAELLKPAIRLTMVLLLPVLLGAAKPPSIASEPVSRRDTSWWRQRFEEKQVEMKYGHVDLLWLGDSITQDWERDGPQDWRNFAPIWQKFYGDRHAINLGFRGDSTCHLLWRLEHGELDGISPKAAILLIGANNFGHIHTNAAQTYEGIVVILDTLHRRLPATQVLLIGVLPSLRSPWISRNTRELNRHLTTLPAAKGSWLRYVDVGRIVEDRGRVDPSRFLDPFLTPPDAPLHPSAPTQAVMAATIEPTVAAMMHDHVHH